MAQAVPCEWVEGELEADMIFACRESVFDAASQVSVYGAALAVPPGLVVSAGSG